MTLIKFNNKTRNTAPYFNNVFDSLFAEALNQNYAINKMPNVNIVESESDYKIELAAPGLTKEDFKIELKKDNLSVWAEYHSFARSFVLPEGVDSDNISANYTNGVLYITLAKKAEAKQIQKEITVS